MLERWGQLIDRASAGLTDPAELFAVGTRITGRLGWTHPDIAGFLTHFPGTVVAYEALHAHPDLHVYLLVALGSPLALPRRRQGAFLKRASAHSRTVAPFSYRGTM